LLYVSKNAKELKINPKKIAMEGESGGAYIILGVAAELAKRNQTNLCKMMFVDIPQGGD